jgi:hypothetical protein
MLDEAEGRAGRKEWAAAVLLPAGVVLLFALLHRVMPATSAAGLSFLSVIVVAYLFFPRIKLNASKLMLGAVAALAVAAALVAGFGRL